MESFVGNRQKDRFQVNKIKTRIILFYAQFTLPLPTVKQMNCWYERDGIKNQTTSRRTGKA
jgi:hypothetical protein